MTSSNDSGFGVGYGDGSGAGYGDGDGDGFGEGYGDGDGCSYGDGSGDGDGYGDGAGCGYGDGFGDGSGSGAVRGGTHSGHLLGIIGGYEVRLVWPGYVRVKCLVFSLRDWKEKWKELAEEHGVFSAPELPLASLAVAHLFSLAESADYTAGGINA